ncbi:hypothetical protein M413DRAFT_128262 [Hebeloma cylindrosporum]|uniref:Uncharacterized protein n=1 Tax=Hebeloma cylindrosporum TaxID=76867 RepID=A0A0C2XWZ3_HEBCY|nr:hypothetical protein M413DRAFT_128262 [Hebeloma cylindrosporum h7]
MAIEEGGAEGLGAARLCSSVRALAYMHLVGGDFHQPTSSLFLDIPTSSIGSGIRPGTLETRTCQWRLCLVGKMCGWTAVHSQKSLEVITGYHLPGNICRDLQVSWNQLKTQPRVAFQ